ncbi:MAG: hypothetical protein AMR96_03400 [Candidatus Adiutrix intracellularis]|jgi:sec-independent protein translocase protein TatA|nr:MAG: hypothetical protein AMR96_03400 [Candidatus Adiutrix intracellularis]MDR2826586.1 twin-arginine translocase TatA/TatE family subunit [Candidatus Adiutrix intracellularis]
MGHIGIWELIIIAILIVVIFGGRNLPELGRTLGQRLTNFRQTIKKPDAPAGKKTGDGRN